MADLKRVYTAVDEASALSGLERFEELWGKKYPQIGKSWRANWSGLILMSKVHFLRLSHNILYIQAGISTIYCGVKDGNGLSAPSTGLSTYFKYPAEIRKIIYTTNTVEGFNRQLRKVTKSKGVFPTDDSLLKMLYLATMDITKKWTGRRQDWGPIHSQIEIFFADRLPN